MQLCHAVYQLPDLAVEVLLAIVVDNEVAEALHLVLAPLPSYPLHRLFAAYAVAPHHSLHACLQRSRHAHLEVEVDALIETAVEEYGTLKPAVAAQQVVACNRGVDEVVDSELVVVRPQQVLREHALLQHIIYIYVVADNLSQPALQGLVVAQRRFAALSQS